MFPSWGIIKYSYIGIVHFIVSHHLQSWNINRSFSVWWSGVCSLWHRCKVSLNHIDNFLVAYISTCNNDNVVSIIIVSMELSHLINCKVGQVISVSSCWLSDHVLSEGISMGGLQSSSFVFMNIILMNMGHYFSFSFKSIFIKEWTSNQIS